MNIKIQLFIFFISVLSHAQNSNPTYREIVTKLFNQYDMNAVNDLNSVFIEKRAVGWNIATINPQAKDTINELFWDSKKRQFNVINFPKKAVDETDEDAIENYLKSTSVDRFNSLEYYGYVGWDADLIQLYENKNSLTNRELYALGYSYSNFANSLLNDNYLFSNSKRNLNLPFITNSMTKNQLEIYLVSENKAIAYFLKLYQRNPDFETIPGQIGIKYYNEIASKFLNLRIYQNEEIAMLQIKDTDLYSSNYKKHAKNLLDSCDKDAILFTVGDNDTFPLLIYQAENMYRQDVLIVNTSLLQDSRYVLMMKNKVLDSDGILLSISSEFIMDDLSEVLLFTNKTKNAISIKNLSAVVSDNFNEAEGFENSYKSIPSNTFTFNNKETQLNWSINDNTIYRNQLVTLDIIATNNWKRPIYFCTGNSYQNYLGLSEYLQLEGLVYKLTSNKGNASEEEIGYVNPLILEQNRKTMFQLATAFKLPIEERQLIMSYRLINNRLANYYINQNRPKDAELILDETLQQYPNNVAYFSYDILSIIESYYKLKLFKKANQLQNQLFQNLENGLDNYTILNAQERKAEYQNTKKYLQFLKSTYVVN